jgi:predicted dehydrogenase
MGRRHLAAYASLEEAGNPHVELVALCDPDSGRAGWARETFARRTGRRLPTAPDLGAAIETTRLDAADVAVPTRFHHTVAENACALGLHVLVEKPLALTMRAARAAVTAAEAAGTTLAVAENFRRIPSNRAIEALLSAGELGRPYWTSSELVVPASMLHPFGQGDWYRNRSMAGSLVALEMGVHEADLLAYWFGSVEQVTASVRTFEPRVMTADGSLLDVTTDDTCFARLELKCGAVAHVALTMAGHGAPLGRRVIVGSRGNVTSAAWEAWEDGEMTGDDGNRTQVGAYVRSFVDGLDPERRERLLPEGTYRPTDLSLDIADPLRYGVATAIVDFARAVLEGGSPEIGAPEALSALATAIALLESSVSGTTVDVRAVLAGETGPWETAIDRDLGLAAHDDRSRSSHG